MAYRYPPGAFISFDGEKSDSGLLLRWCVILTEGLHKDRDKRGGLNDLEAW